MSLYIIKKATARPAAGGDPRHPAWQQAEAAQISTYPWYVSGEKQQTTVRALYSDTDLHLLFICEDRHSSAAVTTLNGKVSNDSCVEVFATIEPEKRPHYFNVEINCCGTLLVGYGPHRFERKHITPELAARIAVYHSIPGPVKQERPDDSQWTIEAAVPFKVLTEFAGIKAPTSGTIWKINFYRCGGMTDPQFASWTDVKTPEPDYHQPEYFQKVRFG